MNYKRTQCDLLAVNHLGEFGRRRPAAAAAYSAHAVRFNGDYLTRGVSIAADGEDLTMTIRAEYLDLKTKVEALRA